MERDSGIEKKQEKLKDAINPQQRDYGRIP